jgi:predicted O-methyltransferase YrrM
MNLYLPNREDGFTYLINTLNLKIGIEIGVREGHYSEYLLQNSNLEILYSLDIFPYPNMLPDTQNKLNKFAQRSSIIVGSTPEQAEIFKDSYFDFIYIDANHTYKAVYQDIITWWPKLRTGGLFAGDDYTNLTNPGEGKYGVVEAVNRFVKEYNQEIYITGAGNNTAKEHNRIANAYGKIIEAGLNGKLDIKFGTTNEDDIKIPNWYMIKQ